jgi:hypothetical protein
MGIVLGKERDPVGIARREARLHHRELYVMVPQQRGRGDDAEGHAQTRDDAALRRGAPVKRGEKGKVGHDRYERREHPIVVTWEAVADVQVRVMKAVCLAERTGQRRSGYGDGERDGRGDGRRKRSSPAEARNTARLGSNLHRSVVARHAASVFVLQPFVESGPDATNCPVSAPRWRRAPAYG